jgi:hypothetical protein
MDTSGQLNAPAVLSTWKSTRCQWRGRGGDEQRGCGRGGEERRSLCRESKSVHPAIVIRFIQKVYGNRSDKQGNGTNISPTSGGRSVGIDHLRTKATEFFFQWNKCNWKWKVRKLEIGRRKWRLVWSNWERRGWTEMEDTDVPHEWERVNIFWQEVSRLKKKSSNEECSAEGENESRKIMKVGRVTDRWT